MTNFVLQAIENAVNTEWVTKFYRWNLIQIDPDDNKFVDCAFACQANFLVTEDKHFNMLRQENFPKIPVISVARFKKELNKI